MYLRRLNTRRVGKRRKQQSTRRRWRMRNFAGPTVAWSLRVRSTYEREKTEAERDKRPFSSTLLGDSDFGALDSLRTGRWPVVFFRHVYFEIRTRRLTHLAIRYGDQASMWRFFFLFFICRMNSTAAPWQLRCTRARSAKETTRRRQIRIFVRLCTRFFHIVISQNGPSQGHGHFPNYIFW